MSRTNKSGKEDLRGGGGSIIAPRIRSRRILLVGLTFLLVVLTSVIYRPVADFEFLKYDDDRYVTANLMVQRGFTTETVRVAFTGMVAGNWHPLTMLSHMLDHSLFGLEAGPHHLVSVGIHLINVMLLVWLVSRWTTRWQTPLLLGALFALHPLRVESVAWISERKDLLSTMFWLLGLGFYTSWVERPRLCKYLMVTLCMTLGLLSKAMLVTFPFTLLLLDFWPLRRVETSKGYPNRRFWQDVWRLVPREVALVRDRSGLLLGGYGGAAIRRGRRRNRHIAALDPAPDGGRGLRGLSGKVLLAGEPCVHIPTSWSVAVVDGLRLLHPTFRNHRTMPCHCPNPPVVVLRLVLVDSGTLVPVIGFVQIGDQWMADRYTYVPLIGLAFALAFEFTRFFGSGRTGRFMGSAVISMVFGGCIILTSRQLATWKDTETLSRHAIQTTGGNGAMWTNLAITHAENGQLEEALRLFQTVVKSKPEDPDAINNVGRVLEQMGRLNEAGGYYVAAINLDADHVLARHNLGRVCTIIGRDDLAVPEFEALIRLQPDNPTGYFQLSRILMGSPKRELRNAARAVSLAERGCKLEPAPTTTGWEVLAASYFAAGRMSDSSRALTESRQPCPRSRSNREGDGSPQPDYRDPHVPVTSQIYRNTPQFGDVDFAGLTRLPGATVLGNIFLHNGTPDLASR